MKGPVVLGLVGHSENLGLILCKMEPPEDPEQRRTCSDSGVHRSPDCERNRLRWQEQEDSER